MIANGLARASSAMAMESKPMRDEDAGAQEAGRAADLAGPGQAGEGAGDAPSRG